jgi:hypothetical protein
MAPRARTDQEIRRDIAAERERLAAAVDDLRASVGAATDVKGKLASQLPVVAAAAVGAGFFFGGGIGATMRLFARRGREGTSEARIGRFRIVDRG